MATIGAATPVTLRHSDWPTTFAARTDYRGARHVKTRHEFGERPAGILGAEDREIAPDDRAWIDAERETHGGSARAVWAAHQDAGYRLPESRPVPRDFVHDCGGAQDTFVQIEAGDAQACVEREPFPRRERSGVPNIDELRRGSPGMPVEHIERRTLGSPRYRLEQVIAMQPFIAIGHAASEARRRADSRSGKKSPETRRRPPATASSRRSMSASAGRQEPFRPTGCIYVTSNVN